MLTETIDKAVFEDKCDVLISTGGVSMGIFDLVKPLIEERGQVLFGRINMKPGKPTTFGKIDNTLIFSLPGNPVSAYVTAHLFVIPALKIMCGNLDSYRY